MEAAAVMAIALANGGGRPPDWQEFLGIIALLLFHSSVSFIEEFNARYAAEALMARLAPKAKVLCYPQTYFIHVCSLFMVARYLVVKNDLIIDNVPHNLVFLWNSLG